MEGSAREIEWLIEDRRRMLADAEEKYRFSGDTQIRNALLQHMRTLKAEIAELEEQLEEAKGSDDPDSEIAEIDSQLRDIAAALDTETDPVVRNNLEVSKRFLQMERNGLLIRMTQKSETRDPAEQKIEELEKLCDTRLRMIEDLRSRLEKAEKDLGYYKSLAEHPERNVSCDRTRVTITAEALSEIRNEAKVLSVENANLKMENRALKREMDLQSANVKELARHCKEADSEIVRLQARVQELRMILEQK